MGGIVRGDIVESTDVMAPTPATPVLTEEQKKAEEAKKADEAKEAKKP